MSVHPLPRRLALLGLLVALTACGGGGDDDGGGGEAPGSGVPAGTDIGCGTANFQAEALRLVNERRAAGASCGTRGNFAATGALRWSDALASAAYLHSKDMADKNYFSHDSQDGRSFSQRITAAGYNWSTVGENIAAGQGTLAAVIDGWMASDGHCANIMSPAFHDIGLGCARNANSQYGIYWTMDLGTAR